MKQRTVRRGTSPLSTNSAVWLRAALPYRPCSLPNQRRLHPPPRQQRRPRGPGATPAPVAADARIEIEINPKAVVSHRAVTGDPSPRQRLLVEGMSMTAVYEFQLVPSISSHAHLATVRLHYRSMPDGREQVLEKNIRVSDIASSWADSPQRTKSASLAAAFGETRARGRDTSAIAEK